MVELPGHYRWSSFCHNVGEREISFIAAHQIYDGLGNSKKERAHAYEGLFRGHLVKDEVKRIRDAWQTGTPLGNDVYRQKIGINYLAKLVLRDVGDLGRLRQITKGFDPFLIQNFVI